MRAFYFIYGIADLVHALLQQKLLHVPGQQIDEYHDLS